MSPKSRCTHLILWEDRKHFWPEINLFPKSIRKRQRQHICAVSVVREHVLTSNLAAMVRAFRWSSQSTLYISRSFSKRYTIANPSQLIMARPNCQNTYSMLALSRSSNLRQKSPQNSSDVCPHAFTCFYYRIYC
jgi:hypothetical protein